MTSKNITRTFSGNPRTEGRQRPTAQYEVATTDPGVFNLLPAALTLVALAAAVIPAVRALRLNPVTSL